jgi:hypothetical protein
MVKACREAKIGIVALARNSIMHTYYLLIRENSTKMIAQRAKDHKGLSNTIRLKW